MAKKNKPQKPKDIEFGSDPFNTLKGFAVSDPAPPLEVAPSVPIVAPVEAQHSFADEMSLLGVDRLDPSASGFEDEPPESQENICAPPAVVTVQNDEDEFLQALGELDVKFTDQFPDQFEPPVASARRMKQLKQGKLSPQASLDLHGFLRSEVATKLSFFLQDAQHQGWTTLLVITGKGLHSPGGEALLRNEAEQFLAGAGGEAVVEWGRAPKQYGGDGALVLFLRSGN